MASPLLVDTQIHTDMQRLAEVKWEKAAPPSTPQPPPPLSILSGSYIIKGRAKQPEVSVWAGISIILLRRTCQTTPRHPSPHRSNPHRSQLNDPLFQRVTCNRCPGRQFPTCIWHSLAWYGRSDVEKTTKKKNPNKMLMSRQWTYPYVCGDELWDGSSLCRFSRSRRSRTCAWRPSSWARSAGRVWVLAPRANSPHWGSWGVLCSADREKIQERYTGQIGVGLHMENSQLPVKGTKY